MAVQEARRHAEQLAQAANASVGAVVSIDESAQGPSVSYRADSSVSAGAAPTTIAAPIEPGRQDLQLSVQVVFELTV